MILKILQLVCKQRVSYTNVGYSMWYTFTFLKQVSSRENVLRIISIFLLGWTWELAGWCSCQSWSHPHRSGVCWGGHDTLFSNQTTRLLHPVWFSSGQLKRFLVKYHLMLAWFHLLLYYLLLTDLHQFVSSFVFSLVSSQCASFISAGKFEEAYNGYTAALHWLAPDDSQKSHILVALASLQYKFQNCEEAKKLLFQG